MPKLPKKLIEVALPLDDINKAAAREKSIRHGHPSTLHLWWARRPLAAARAVLFAQLVNDPGSTYEGDKRTKAAKAAIHAERERLFEIIRDLVQWENSTNEEVLEKARAEIRKSWAYTCRITGDDPERMPPVLDPFCGGGSIPLEAQRLGLEAHASDLNPVAVLINKAMVEIPSRFSGRPPLGPIEGDGQGRVVKQVWPGATGLAEDVLRYGAWMNAEAEKRTGHLYPKAVIDPALIESRPDLEPFAGEELTVVAWLWARTVPSPNPVVNGTHVPLVASYWLCKKPNKLAWVEPIVDENSNTWRFVVRCGKPANPEMIGEGTKAGRGNFRCLLTGTPMPATYIRAMGKEGNIGHRMIAVIASAPRKRVYLTPDASHEAAADCPEPERVPLTDLPRQALGFRVQNYGYSRHASLYTNRQKNALDTLSDLIQAAHEKVIKDAIAAGLPHGSPLDEDGSGAHAYADAISILLAMSVSRRQDRWSAFSIWHTTGEKVEGMIRLSALPMTWEFAEANPFSSSSGNFLDGVSLTSKTIANLGNGIPGKASQADAIKVNEYNNITISTDPPYYDNVPYADLSDLFYVWLRRMLKPICPQLMNTLLVPKAEEIVADSARHGGADNAKQFFMERMQMALQSICSASSLFMPVSIYYAFKQSQQNEAGTVSAGWDAFLTALINSGFIVTGTWPMRTEQTGGLRNAGRNSLASSVVMICRRRDTNAPTITRRQLARELNQQLPDDLEEMIHGTEGVSPIAPVDLAQAAIGPGMAIFSQYKAVLEADGSPMSVHNALIMINKAIDEYFDAAEGSMDGLTRFCAQWVQQYGFKTGPYGEADGISRACGVSADGHPEAIESGKGKVRLRPAKEYDRETSPEMGKTSIWICLHAIAARLEKDGTASAGAYLAVNPGAGPDIRNLAYRLYTICERAKLADHARTYNNVVTSWDAICEASRETGHAGEQQSLFGDR